MMHPHRGTLRSGFSRLVHIWRAGGKARISFPDLRTGKPIVRSVDQRKAEEAIIWMMDRIIAEMLQREERGEQLSTLEKEAVKLWRTQVPHAYDWSAPRDGPSLLVALNADGRAIGAQWQRIVLAAHPGEYDVGWQASTLPRRAPGLRGRINIYPGSWGRPIFIARIGFPPNAELLTAWTQFDHLNVEKAVLRLSPRDRRYYLLPYGMWAYSDSREVLFNRDYEPIYERPLGSPATTVSNLATPITKKAKGRWFYLDEHKESQKRRRAEAALALFLAGEPMPADCGALLTGARSRERKSR